MRLVHFAGWTGRHSQIRRDTTRTYRPNASAFPLRIVSDFTLVLTKTISNGNAVLRHPVASKLREVVDVVSIDLRSDVDMGRSVECKPGSYTNLEMARTVHKRA